MTETSDGYQDSIIGDVRRARAKLLAEHGNDLGALVRHLMAEQQKHPERVVNLRALKEARARQ